MASDQKSKYRQWYNQKKIDEDYVATRNVKRRQQYHEKKKDPSFRAQINRERKEKYNTDLKFRQGIKNNAKRHYHKSCKENAILQFILDYKRINPVCPLCHNEYKCQPECLTFHHINSKEKKFDIYAMHKNKRITLPLLQEEIAKCVLICNNCHKTLHAQKEKSVDVFKDNLLIHTLIEYL